MVHSAASQIEYCSKVGQGYLVVSDLLDCRHNEIWIRLPSAADDSAVSAAVAAS